MDDSLQWLKNKVEDMKLKVKFLETAKEDLHVKLHTLLQTENLQVDSEENIIVGRYFNCPNTFNK